MEKRDVVLYYCIHGIINKCMVNKRPNNTLAGPQIGQLFSDRWVFAWDVKFVDMNIFENLWVHTIMKTPLLFEILLLCSLSSRVRFKCTVHSQCSRHSPSVGWATHGGLCGSSDVSSDSVSISFKVHAIDQSVLFQDSHHFFWSELVTPLWNAWGTTHSTLSD